jgi:hypothetical protein
MNLWQSDIQRTSIGRLDQQIVGFNGINVCFVTFQASLKTRHLKQGTTIGVVQKASNLPPIFVCNKIHHLLVGILKYQNIPQWK